MYSSDIYTFQAVLIILTETGRIHGEFKYSTSCLLLGNIIYILYSILQSSIVQYSILLYNIVQ